MNRILIFYISFFSLIFSLPATAEMYKSVDEKGNITYSDTPPDKDSKALEPPMLNAMPSVKPPARPLPLENEETEKQTQYSLLQITAPANEATLRNNSGNISITLSLTPALNIKQGHSLSILLDGNVVKDKLITSATSLNNIDRGTHILSASVNSSNGATLLSSGPVTVHLHRASQ